MSTTSPTLFLSYSLDDGEFAQRFRFDLQAHGYEVWIDKVGLQAGTPDWDEAVRQAIRSSRAILLVASPSSRSSPHVRDELGIARMYGLAIIPIWARGDEWMDSIPLGWGSFQYCDARGGNYGEAINRVVAALRERGIAGVAPMPAVPMPAVPMPAAPPNPPLGQAPGWASGAAPMPGLAPSAMPGAAPLPGMMPVMPASGPAAPVSAPIPVPAPAPPSSPLAGAQPRNPYKGLRPFSSGDAGDFFGREALITDFTTRLQQTLAAEHPGAFGSRVFTLVGASGSGKSSVAMAGILPHLHGGAIPGSERWIYLDPMTPGAHPLDALAVALSRALPEKSLRAIRDDLYNGDDRGLSLLAAGMVGQSGARVVLLIDQCEELFTLTADERERRQFITLLVSAATDPRGSLITLATLRADFYDRPMLYLELFQLMQAHLTPVLPMSVDDLRAVIERPAALSDVQLLFEGPLVGDLLYEVQGQAGALPLLQFTLDQLYQHRVGRQLTLQAYRAIGGVRGALARHAEATFAALPSDAHRGLARFLFMRLVDPGATDQDSTRRRADIREFALPDPQATQILWAVADAFVSARLLMTNEIAGTTTLEISHEALIREWTRLADWLREGRADVRLQRQISADAREWLQHGRPQDRLYRGVVLAEAQAWLPRNAPSADEVAFIQAAIGLSQGQATAELKRQAQELELQRKVARRQRIALGLSGVLGVVLIVAVILQAIEGANLNSANASLHSLNQQLAQTNEKLNAALPATVTTLADSGSGSLRAAIAAASDGSAITFSPSLHGTITLTSGELTITHHLIISGPGAQAITISGNHASRIVHIGSQADQTSYFVTISNLTLTDGFAASGANGGNGGAIYNDSGSSLTLINDTITSNHASASGGGIYNAGNLKVVDSHIAGNQAGRDGGGIFNDGGWTNFLQKDQITGNHAGGYGGGIAQMVAPNGGSSGWSDVYEGTITGNSAGKGGGGLYLNTGYLFDRTTSQISSNKPNNFLCVGSAKGQC